MTTEDDFQNALDANPEDWMTRLVFADWLQERGDVRAEGYRALGVLRAHAGEMPHTIGPEIVAQDMRRWPLLWFFWSQDSHAHGRLGPASEELPNSGLPEDWCKNIEKRGALNPPTWNCYAATRREAEDAAALAFAKLSPERRAELLVQGVC